MAMKRKVIAEYINQIREDMPGTCIHRKVATLIRGYDCEYLSVPRLETEPIMCKLHNCETTPDCFCCWAKRTPHPRNFWRGDGFIEVCQ